MTTTPTIPDRRSIIALRPRLLQAAFLTSVALSGGCPSLTPYPTQAPVHELIEPKTHRSYLLYVPSIYNDKRTWPMVVACHGTKPYDTPDRQMSEWAQFGEDKGIIILAPTLDAARGDFPPTPPEQIARQHSDEEAVLGMVAVTRNAYRIADEQIFMTGWSAGAYTILYTGLRNPDVFRALAIRQGTFDEKYLDVGDNRVDRWQPIKIIYGRLDFLRDQSTECVKWLRGKGQYVEQEEITGSHRRIDPTLPWSFFTDVMKKRPWIRITALPKVLNEPLTLRFSVRSIPAVRKVKWHFGDGAESYDAAPEHTFASGGDYEVAVNVELTGGKKYQRRRVIRVMPSGEN